MTEEDVLAGLAVNFPAPQYAFITHARNGTGYAATRTADAIAMSLWPSRGLALHGFEVKVSRGDWLRELRNPAKADEMFGYFDHWWLAVADTDPKIVADGELPDTWGLIKVAKRVKIVAPAPKLPSAREVDRLLLAAILRRATESILPEAKIKEAYERGKREGNDLARELADNASKRELDRLRERVDTFEKDSGINLDDWNYRRIGAAAKALINATPEALKDRFEVLRRHFASGLETIDSAIKEISKLSAR